MCRFREFAVALAKDLQSLNGYPAINQTGGHCSCAPDRQVQIGLRTANRICRARDDHHDGIPISKKPRRLIKLTLLVLLERGTTCCEKDRNPFLRLDTLWWITDLLRGRRHAKESSSDDYST